MPDLRPALDDAQVLTALDQYVATPVTKLTPVEGGSVARTFSFEADAQAYIVRFNYDKMFDSNFPKEQYILQKLSSSSIPLAPLLFVGRLDELHFAISRRAEGQRLELLTPVEVRQLLPEMIRVLDTIHQNDISATQGYGVFNAQGQGLAKSWHGFLLEVEQEEEDERGYFGKWHHFFADTFLERDLFYRIYQRMQQLLDSCPTERYLLHRGYDLSNILAQDGKITAVVDWIGAGYGDFVYDIAWLDFWAPWLNVAEGFLLFYQERQIAVPAYAERLLCYQCYIALDAMRFYAKGGHEQAYQWVRQVILAKLKP